MPLKTRRARCYLIALLTIMLIALPEIVSAQRGPVVTTAAMREACGAQVRALGMRGMGGGMRRGIGPPCSSNAYGIVAAFKLRP
jgi:hypothetical protein